MLTAQRARELFSYDPVSGILRHRTSPANNVKVGDIAGYLDGGYFNVKVDGQRIRAHRIIWLIVTGAWPEPEVDHKDRDQLNNRWANLREATRGQNCANKKRRSDNTSGYKGVRRHSAGRWRADVMVDGKREYLGLFATPDEAHAAYVAAARNAFGEYAHA